MTNFDLFLLDTVETTLENVSETAAESSASPDFILGALALGASVVIAVAVIVLAVQIGKLARTVDSIKLGMKDIKRENSELYTKTAELEDALRRAEKSVSRLSQQNFLNRNAQETAVRSPEPVEEAAYAQPDVPPQTTAYTAPEKTDEEKFLDFFNGGSSASLPDVFSVVKLSMNGGNVFTDNSGYDCYVLGNADKTGIVMLYPGKVAKSPEMRTYYSAVFDFVSEGRDAQTIIPCRAERNAYGSFKIMEKGKVIF